MSALLGAIVPYYTSTKGRVPTDQVMDALGARQLEVGEIAFNLEDSLIFSKKPDGSIVQMGGSTLGKLLDVNAGENNPPLPGQALIWDGTKWNPQDRSNLQDLENVTRTVPFDAAVLQYDANLGKWVPSEAGLPGGLRARDMDLGQVLTYDTIRIKAQWLLNFDVNTGDNGPDTPIEVTETPYNGTASRIPDNLNPIVSDGERFGDSLYRHYGRLDAYEGYYNYGIRIPPEHVGPPLRTSQFTLEFWFKADEFRGGVLLASNEDTNKSVMSADAGWFRIRADRYVVGDGYDKVDLNDDRSSGRNDVSFYQYALTGRGQQVLRSPEARTKTVAMRGSYGEPYVNTEMDEQIPNCLDDQDGWHWYDGGDTSAKYPGGPWNPSNSSSREAELLRSEARGDYPPNLDQYPVVWTSYDDLIARGSTPVTQVFAKGSPHLDDSPSGFLYLTNANKNSAQYGDAYLVGTRDAEIYDGEWHHIVFQHEGEGVYTCHVDGEVKERRYRQQLEVREWNSNSPYRFDGDGNRVIDDFSSKTLFVGPVDFWEWTEISMGINDASPIPCEVDALQLIRYAKHAGKDRFDVPDVAPTTEFTETKWTNKDPFPAPFALERNLVDTNVATTVFAASGNLNGNPSGATSFTAGDYLGNVYELELDFDASTSSGVTLKADWESYPTGSFYFDGSLSGARPTQESGSIKEIGSQDFTIAFWFRFDGDAGDRYEGYTDEKFLIKLGELGPRVALKGVNNTLVWNWGGGVSSREVQGVWVENQDYHVAMVRSADEDKVLLFLNGNLIDSYSGVEGNVRYGTVFTVPQLGETPETDLSQPDKVGFQGWIAEVVIKIGQAFWTDTFTPPPVWGDGSFEFPNTVFGALGIWEGLTYICTEGATYEIDGSVKTPSVWMPLGGGAGGGAGGELGDLLNVDLTSTLARPGNLLGFDGNNWIPVTKLSLDYQLEELGNVVHEALDIDGQPYNRDGSALVWNEADKQWKPGFPALSRLREPALLPGVEIGEFFTDPTKPRNSYGHRGTITDFKWSFEGPRLTQYNDEQEGVDEGWTRVGPNYGGNFNYEIEIPYEEFWDLKVLDGFVGNTPNGPTGWTVGYKGIGWRTDGTWHRMDYYTYYGGSNPRTQSREWDCWFQFFSYNTTELKRAWIKKVVREGRTWLVIRQDWRVPYSGGAGFNTEFWLSTRGEVIVMISKQLTGGINWHFTEHKGWFKRGEPVFQTGCTPGSWSTDGDNIHGDWWPYCSLGFQDRESFPSSYGFGWYFKPGRVDPNPPEIWDGSGINDLKDVRTDGAEEGDALLWDGDSNFVPTKVLTKVDRLNQVLDVNDSALQGIPRESGYVLTWDNDLQQWAPKPIPLPKIGRGDAGDFDLGETQGIFLFGVYGGGDFTDGTEDLPIELTDQSDTDGGELTGGIPTPPLRTAATSEPEH